ncbi:G patch domain-containing protein 2 isoform X3 [Phyllopteryx taeniolatus]|uniref:G patch domain-containing protein 2 isoform X3 n=1 Tax=Phyllopteryx taeniolatus TaxID=161469 RepID=UPI002AD37E33|nr:G patch domain-containing protein 2 isoform X3 [Phyllopteryx taeniolatus]
MFRAANRKSIGKAGNGWHFRRTMDELVHDLVSALEESSEQAARGGDGGDHALTVGCLLKRQARKRRGRKRRSDNPHPPWETGHLSEGSESSVEEHKDYRAGTGGVSASNSHTRDNSDSDEQLGPKRRTPQTSDAGRSKRPLWPDDPGVLGSAEGTRSLRRRRKFKRMAVDPPAEPEPPSTMMLAPPSVPKPRAAGTRPHRLSPSEGRVAMEICGDGLPAVGVKNRMKKRKLALQKVGADAADEGVVVESEEPISSLVEGCKDKMELEEQKGSDEEMSDRCETSSVSNSSDGGLYTNDEGRQGDDEQSDWFCEGEPGSGTGGACGVAGVIPWWERDAGAEELDLNDPVFNNILTGSFPLMTPDTRRGLQARLNRLHGHPRRCDDGLQGGSGQGFGDGHEPWFSSSSGREHGQLHWDTRTERGHRRSCSVKTANRRAGTWALCAWGTSSGGGRQPPSVPWRPQRWWARTCRPFPTATLATACCRAWAGPQASAWVPRGGASRSPSGPYRDQRAPGWASTDRRANPFCNFKAEG